jgi:hypothetical protein
VTVCLIHPCRRTTAGCPECDGKIATASRLLNEEPVRDGFSYLESLFMSRLNTKRAQLVTGLVANANRSDTIAAHARAVLDGRLSQLDMDIQAFVDALGATRHRSRGQ